MIGLSGEIPLVSHSDVTSPFPPSGNGGYASNRDVLVTLSRSDSLGDPTMLCLDFREEQKSCEGKVDNHFTSNILFS